MLIHRKLRGTAFVPARATTGAGRGAQGWQRAKCAPALAKMQLSTRQAALYYYDYVFIKEIRRRQRTTGATRTAGVDEGGMHQPDVPALPEMKDGIWRRPKGCGGPWAQMQAPGDLQGPQALHGRSGALRRELLSRPL